jgi:hypothetical protein
MADAACAGVGPGEFFGLDAGGMRWCQRCSVMECCFWWAVVGEREVGYRFGIWGGASPATRERVAEVTDVGYARARLARAVDQWAEQRVSTAGPAQRRAG